MHQIRCRQTFRSSHHQRASLEALKQLRLAYRNNLPQPPTGINRDNFAFMASIILTTLDHAIARGAEPIAVYEIAREYKTKTSMDFSWLIEGLGVDAERFDAIRAQFLNGQIPKPEFYHLIDSLFAKFCQQQRMLWTNPDMTDITQRQFAFRQDHIVEAVIQWRTSTGIGVN